MSYNPAIYERPCPANPFLPDSQLNERNINHYFKQDKDGSFRRIPISVNSSSHSDTSDQGLFGRSIVAVASLAALGYLFTVV